MALFADRFLRFPDHDKYVVGKRNSILWPVNVWRVLYPEPAHVEINIFQQAILGLARAKTTDIYEIGKLLCLAPELIGFIVGTELLPRRLMDSKGITEKGLEALDDLEFAASRQLVGYAYQDAISGELLPRFSMNLPEIEYTEIKNGFPVFLLDRGKGDTEKPFSVQGVGTNVTSLSENDFFNAYSRYRRDFENIKILNDDDFSDQDRVKIFGIECIEETPVPMYLWCWLYKDDGSDKPWLVSDPFGLRKASPWMSERVRKLAPKSPALAKILSGLLGVDPNEQLTPETLDMMDQQVLWKVFSDYDWASRVPQLGRFLTGYLNQRGLVESRERPSEEQLEYLLMQSQKLCEGTLQWMLERWPGFSTSRLPNSEKWPSRNEAITTFKSLNISAINDSVASSLAGQQPPVIKKARTFRNQSLKALLAAALLSSSEFPEHALNHAGLVPSDLEKLIALADVRNKAAHASDRRFQKAEVLSHSYFVMDWTLKFKEWY